MSASYLSRLQQATAEIVRARGELTRAATVAAETKFELDFKEAQLTAAGLEGSNENIRKANLFLKTEEEVRAALFAEIALKQAQRDFDIATAQFAALKYELRSQELAVRSIELRSAGQ